MTQYLKDQVKRIEDFRDKIHDFKSTLRKPEPGDDDYNQIENEEAERYNKWRDQDLQKETHIEAEQRFSEDRAEILREGLKAAEELRESFPFGDRERIAKILAIKPGHHRPRRWSDLKTLLIATIIGGLIGTAIGMLLNLIFS